MTDNSTIPNLKGERWEKMKLRKKTNRKKYQISNKGRIKSINKSTKKERILKDTPINCGFIKITVKYDDGSCGGLYTHREVAKYFLKPPSAKHKFVIHKNFDRSDNRSANLKWVNENGQKKYVKERAEFMGFEKVHIRGRGNYKLTASKVARIKRELISAKKTRTKISEKYGVTITQLKRIERGENWSDVEAAPPRAKKK